LIRGNCRLLIADGEREFPYLQIRRSDLVLGHLDLRRELFLREREGIDGRLKRTFLRADRVELSLIRGNLRLERFQLLVVRVYLGL